MSAEGGARAYARAFYEAALERWVAALDLVAGRLEQNQTLRERLEAQHDDLPRRQALLNAILPGDTDQPVRNLLYTLLQRGELPLLPQVVSDLRQRATHAEGPTEVEVVSALPLTDAECRQLQQKLEQQFGGELALRYRIDPAILGGIVVRAGDQLIDGSVASRLAALRQTLGVTAGEQGKS